MICKDDLIFASLSTDNIEVGDVIVYRQGTVLLMMVYQVEAPENIVARKVFQIPWIGGPLQFILDNMLAM